MKKILVASVPLAVLALVAASCWPQGNFAPSTCREEWTDDAYASCVKRSCCPEIEACAASDTCRYVRWCRSRGGPIRQCRSGIDGARENDAAIAMFEAVLACESARCAAALDGIQPDGGPPK